MPYNPNIPQAGDFPSQSQSQILANFQVLNTAFAQDHGAYNSPTQGQHNQITFPIGPLAGQPFTYLAGQIGLQNLTQLPTSRPDIWLSRGTSAPYPMTGYMVGGINAANMWTYLPSGMLINMGVDTVGAAGSYTLTYAAAFINFPGFSAQSGPPIVTSQSAQTVFVTAFTLTNFTFTVSGATTISWMVMGL